MVGDINALFTSNILLDTDIGVYRLIKDSYNNPKYFKLNILDAILERYTEIIPKRDTINPLSFIIRDEYKDSIDNLYNEILDTKYTKVLELSEFTSVDNLLDLFISRRGIETTILCKNLEEKQIFKNKNSDIIISEYKDVDIKPYHVIYTKYYKDYSKFNKVMAKTLYFAFAKYNFQNDDTIDPQVYINLDGPNNFKAINLY